MIRRVLSVEETTRSGTNHAAVVNKRGDGVNEAGYEAAKRRSGWEAAVLNRERSIRRLHEEAHSVIKGKDSSNASSNEDEDSMDEREGAAEEDDNTKQMPELLFDSDNNSNDEPMTTAAFLQSLDSVSPPASQLPDSDEKDMNLSPRRYMDVGRDHDDSVGHGAHHRPQRRITVVRVPSKAALVEGLHCSRRASEQSRKTLRCAIPLKHLLQRERGHLHKMRKGGAHVFPSFDAVALAHSSETVVAKRSLLRRTASGKVMRRVLSSSKMTLPSIQSVPEPHCSAPPTASVSMSEAKGVLLESRSDDNVERSTTGSRKERKLTRSLEREQDVSRDVYRGNSRERPRQSGGYEIWQQRGVCDNETAAHLLAKLAALL